MIDRGEKIVSLAREILACSEIEMNTPSCSDKDKNKDEKRGAINTACLAALQTSAGVTMTRNCSYEERRPVNRYERIELEALFFYVSREMDVEENALQARVARALDLLTLKDISFGEYKRIRSYLCSLLDQHHARIA